MSSPSLLLAVAGYPDSPSKKRAAMKLHILMGCVDFELYALGTTKSV
jgi:hypothetical protein